MSEPIIVIVEDEPLLGQLLCDNLSHQGYHVELIANGSDALERIQKGSVDLVVLDLMLPGIHGLEILERVRQTDKALPILILSALSADEQRIKGLSLGADDFLAKPFNLQELLLRVAGLLRRAKPQQPVASKLLFGDNEVDLDTYESRTASDQEHRLTQKEASLLRFLAGNAGRVVSRNEILDAVWGRDAFPTERTIDNFIVRFRKLFEKDPRNPIHFHTLRGVGYRFEKQ